MPAKQPPSTKSAPREISKEEISSTSCTLQRGLDFLMTCSKKVCKSLIALPRETPLAQNLLQKAVGVGPSPMAGIFLGT